jgi:hypothetical protein
MTYLLDEPILNGIGSETIVFNLRWPFKLIYGAGGTTTDFQIKVFHAVALW